MSSGKILLGVLAGIAAEATLGILFAPDKGSKTRKKIADKGNDYAEELKGKFDDFRNVLSEKFYQVKDETDDLVSKTKKKHHETNKKVENTTT
ncbi:MAG TPA: YtxH domain-containing protein [Bacteroidia bacterium]|nr:YtxH domain-containing protein [Bacteroidia bacterium]